MLREVKLLISLLVIKWQIELEVRSLVSKDL